MSNEKTPDTLSEKERSDFNQDFQKAYDRFQDEANDWDPALDFLLEKYEMREQLIKRDHRRNEIKIHKSEESIRHRVRIAELVVECVAKYGDENTPSWPILMLQKYPNYRDIPFQRWESYVVPYLDQILNTMRYNRSGL